MRMWMVPPKILCTKHLLGEHVETHMFVGTIKKGKKVTGYVNNNLLQFSYIKERHDELVEEMIERGITHKSDLLFNFSDYSYSTDIIDSKVDVSKSLNDLLQRCLNCRQLFFQHISRGTL